MGKAMIQNPHLYLSAAITLVVGLIGVAAGYGALRQVVKSLQKNQEQLKADMLKEMAAIKARQAVLRGEDNDGRPRYVQTWECEKTTQLCQHHICDEIKNMQKSIDANNAVTAGLRNFARYFLQDKGMSLTEIDKLLGKNHL